MATPAALGSTEHRRRLAQRPTRALLAGCLLAWAAGSALATPAAACHVMPMGSRHAHVVRAGDAEGACVRLDGSERLPVIAIAAMRDPVAPFVIRVTHLAADGPRPFNAHASDDHGLAVLALQPGGRTLAFSPQPAIQAGQDVRISLQYTVMDGSGYLVIQFDDVRSAR